MLRVSRRPGRVSRATRDPLRTRERILRAAFQEMYRSGFRSADLNAILAAARVTKGALYHHFDNKEALGYAVVDEVIASITREKWLWPLRNSESPIDTLIGIILATPSRPGDLLCGCPLNNLSQEMSPLDERFRRRTAKIFDAWHDAIAMSLKRGKKHGLVRSNVDPREAATFLIAAYEGLTSLVKNSRDARMLQAGQQSIIRFLESLRAVRNPTKRRGVQPG
jgi:TetR/AcrR family transcriptional regulator, transcriptional repressor for nem operon